MTASAGLATTQPGCRQRYLYDHLYPKPPKPTFLQGPYKIHIRVYNKNLQKSRFWQVRVGSGVVGFRVVYWRLHLRCQALRLFSGATDRERSLFLRGCSLASEYRIQGFRFQGLGFWVFGFQGLGFQYKHETDREQKRRQLTIMQSRLLVTDMAMTLVTASVCTSLTA